MLCAHFFPLFPTILFLGAPLAPFISTYSNLRFKYPVLGSSNDHNSSDYNEPMQQYMLMHEPHIGGFLVSQWAPSSNQFAYTVVANDSAVHSLPLLFNVMSNVQINVRNNTNSTVQRIGTSLQPLGAPQVSFDGSRYWSRDQTAAFNTKNITHSHTTTTFTNPDYF